MNKLTTSTIQEIQSLAEAASRIPGTDAAHEINKRILNMLVGAGQLCSGEAPQPTPAAIESSCAVDRQTEQVIIHAVSPDLAAELDVLRRFIAIENQCDAELKTARESVEKLEDMKDNASAEKLAAIKRIARALGSTSEWLFP